MRFNPYQSPRPLPGELEAGSLRDGRWSLTVAGLFAGGYVGAWVGSLSGAAVGVLFALLAGAGATGVRDPAFAFVEGLVSTGLLMAILGTLGGGGLGAVLGVLLGALVATFGRRLRSGFLWLSAVAASAAAAALAVAAFRFDAHAAEWRPLAGGQLEFVARVAAVGLVGLGGLFGGALLGRILREAAWEPGAREEVVEESAEPRIREGDERGGG